MWDGAGFWPGGACPHPESKRGLGHSRGSFLLASRQGPPRSHHRHRGRADIDEEAGGVAPGILWSGSGGREMRRGGTGQEERALSPSLPRADFAATLRVPTHGPAGPLGQGTRVEQGQGRVSK